MGLEKDLIIPYNNGDFYLRERYWRENQEMENNQGENVKAYQYVFDYFSEQIISGKLKINDKIATERDIAEQLGVSRNTIREVMHMLEINGLIECVQGSGNYVRCDPQEYMLKSSRMIMALLGINNSEIFYLRRGFEMTAFELAIDAAKQEDLDEMKRILEQMDKAETSRQGAEFDQAFHKALLNASHNRLLTLYYGMANDLINAFIKDFRARILTDKQRYEQLRRSHWGIYDALVNKDIDAGLQAMNRHFGIVNEYLLKRS